MVARRFDASVFAGVLARTCIGWAAVPMAWITYSFAFAGRGLLRGEVGVMSGTCACLM